MTDPNTTRMDMERKLATVKTLDELAGFCAGLVLLSGVSWERAHEIYARRRAEIGAGK